MKLSESQIEIIRTKVEEGAQLNDIQKLIQSEFQENITFMETRFLLSDLGVTIKSPDEPVKEDTSPEGEDIPEHSEEPVGAGRVNVSVAQVTRPGAIINGTVTWSDGMTSSWAVDQMGRLALDSQDKEYQPSPEDIEQFQLQLREQMGG